MNTIYLHGLESDPGGPKPEYLAGLGHCLAPAMRYRDPAPWARLLSAIAAQSWRPDLVIGSSMGGYFGWHLANRLGVDSLLFNPALGLGPMPEAIDVEQAPPGTGCHHVVCGAEDDVVDPALSGAFLAAAGARVVRVVVPGMGHRTPYEIFVAAVDAVRSGAGFSNFPL